MTRLRPLSLLILLAQLDVAQAEEKRPLVALPYEPSLDLASMDTAVDPCQDFYLYSCGGWMRKNPIPSDQPAWTVYGKLQDENEQLLWGLLEQAARPDPARPPARQKTGDYFAACMDEAAIDKAGASPLKPRLDAIAALASKHGLAALLGRLHPETSGGFLFGFGSAQDFQDSSQVIAFAVAGGLGLPDRDYYLKDDPASKGLRSAYVAHVARMLQLIGDPPSTAAKGSRAVLEIETALARVSLTRVERRDPYQVYHRMTRKELQALTPSFRWDEYLAAAGRPELESLNVTQPGFFRGVEAQLRKESLERLKTYLRWHAVHDAAPYLSRPFVDEDFAFFDARLLGVKEIEPRWKRCVEYVDRDLGEALGQVFVEAAFGADVKGATVEMVRQVEVAMEARIQALPWMSAPTRARALEKLHAMRNKVGYPEAWRDYSSLEVRPGDFLVDVSRAVGFEFRRQMERIGKPVDRSEWDMSAPTVNAYYNPSLNDMNFPAGILLPPLFDPKMDAAPNYGNTGSTIGHELTHGFDDQGRQFDAQGNLKDWWTAEDAAEFQKRTGCIVDQYAQYPVVDDIKINSRLTLGEDVADLGGTIIAYEAWKNATREERREPKDGLTPEQRFFVGFAQWACGHETPEAKRVRAATNPHSPGKWRINGVVVNMPEFRDAFQCKAGSPMVREPVCRVW
jgi:putative endopeptidase